MSLVLLICTQPACRMNIDLLMTNDVYIDLLGFDGTNIDLQRNNTQEIDLKVIWRLNINAYSS